MTEQLIKEEKKYEIPNYIDSKKTKDYASSIVYGIHTFVKELISKSNSEKTQNVPNEEKIAQGAAEEVSRAMCIHFGEKDKVKCEWDTIAETYFNFSESMPEVLKNTQEYFVECQENLVALALFCRQNGIMPYYITMILGYGFWHCQNNSEPCEVKTCIENKGIKEIVSEMLQISAKPDLVQMIYEHYLRAKDAQFENHRIVALKKQAYELGFNYEKKYKGCSQCALLTLFDIVGETDDLLFQEATGLSGGMAICNDGACGGYTGGILMMGKYVGRRIDQMKIDGDKDHQYTAYYMAQALHDKFIETFGSVICKDIHCSLFGTWYCLREKSVRDSFEAAGAHQDKCTVVIANACVWICEILVKYGYLYV